jgi:hypothetical protein
MPSPTPAISARTKLTLAILLGPLGLWTVAVAAGSAVASGTVPNGQCHGIGWGCVLTPRESVIFAGVVAGVVVVPVATLVAALVAWFGAPEGRARRLRTALTLYALLVAAGVTVVAHAASG